jgi:hypothetical protein
MSWQDFWRSHAPGALRFISKFSEFEILEKYHRCSIKDFFKLFVERNLGLSSRPYKLLPMPVRRRQFGLALMAVRLGQAWPMKFMGHAEEVERRPAKESPTAPSDNGTAPPEPSSAISSEQTALFTGSRDQPYYHSLFVLAPEAGPELTRAFNGLARTRKSCFFNVDYDPRMFTEVGAQSVSVQRATLPSQSHLCSSI